MPTALQRIETVPGTPLVPKSGEIDSNPGAVVTVIDETVPANEEWFIRVAYGTSRMPGDFKILIDNNDAGFGNSTELDDNIIFSWSPFRRLVAGKVLKMTFDALSDFPVEKVRGQIQLNSLPV